MSQAQAARSSLRERATADAERDSKALFAAAYMRDRIGDRFEAIELDPKDAQPAPGMAPHSPLTLNLRDKDPEGPTKKAERRVIEFFRQRLLSPA